MDPRASHRRVLGIDIDIRARNRESIETHPLAHKIDMIEGSSIAPEVTEKVWAIAHGYDRVLVCLDSNHTHEHVMAELQVYAPLTSVGSYCVVFDTVIEDMPPGMFPGRPWGPGNNPKTAVWEYLNTHPEFEIDKSIQAEADDHRGARWLFAAVRVTLPRRSALLSLSALSRSPGWALYDRREV